MIIESNIHTHTTFCDGKNTPEEMINAAIDAGMKTIGFSEHAGVTVTNRAGMAPRVVKEYKSELFRLREKYKGIIDVLTGIEHEAYSCENSDDWDFVIGSLHFLEKEGELFPVDYSADILKSSVEKYYGGDYDALACDYYETFADYICRKKPSVVGHFDLITKYCEREGIFREKSDIYREAQMKALDKILSLGITFEVNTGAISRNLRTAPYPDDFVLREICKRGGEVVISSDAHRADTINYAFDIALEHVKNAGFNKIVIFTAEGKKHVDI